MPVVTFIMPKLLRIFENSTGKSLSEGWIQKDSSATDYSDISELAEEEEEKYYKHAVSIFSQKQNTSTAGKLH